MERDATSSQSSTISPWMMEWLNATTAEKKNPSTKKERKRERNNFFWIYIDVACSQSINSIRDGSSAHTAGGVLHPPRFQQNKNSKKKDQPKYREKDQLHIYYWYAFGPTGETLGDEDSQTRYTIWGAFTPLSSPPAVRYHTDCQSGSEECSTPLTWPFSLFN